MKREWKNFKIDPKKVYQRIGQSVVYISLWAIGEWFLIFGFMQNTIY